MKKTVYLILLALMSMRLHAQTNQRSIVEHFTNSWCSVCASKNPALYSLLDQHQDVIHIAYHPSRPYPGCIFSMHNMAENDARKNFYGIYGSTPRVVVNGSVIPIQSPTIKPTDLDAHLGLYSAFRINVMQERDGIDSINVKTTISKIDTNPSNMLDLYVQLAEKKINYASPNGESVHHDVFRASLYFGSISLMNMGDSLTINRKYAYHPDWEKDEMIAISFIQDQATKVILQAEESNLLEDLPATIFENEENDFMLVYPNPASHFIYLKPELLNGYENIAFINTQGEIVLNSQVNDRLNIETLSRGVYILKLSGELNKPIYTKFIKQ